MNEAWAIVVAAAIPVLATGVGFLIRELRGFRLENRQDHANVMTEMRKIRNGMDRLSDRFNDHMDWHSKK